MAYEMREFELPGTPGKCVAAFTLDGLYIGNEDWAKLLDERGIVPEYRTPDSQVCSIGFCEREKKWYGWSHRAMAGFGIGDTVKRGDCAFTADNVDDLMEDYVEFFADVMDPAEARARLTPDYENGRVWVGEKTYKTKVASGADGVVLAIEQPDMMPDGFLTMGGHWMGIGRGEWTAKTLEDAKQMACDFAEGVD